MKKYNIYCGTNKINEIIILIKSLFSLNSFVDKKIINDYEKKFSLLSRQKFSFSFGSGRMSLYCGLKALGIKPEDEIIIPAFTCVVVPNAILYLKAKPIYCDITYKDFNIDLKKIKKLINKKTRAIYIQHTFGYPCDISSIKNLCKKKNILVIEDCAHIFPNKENNKIVHKHSDISYFSTDHSKFINTHLGGMITTNNKKIAKKLKIIKSSTKSLDLIQNLQVIISFILENILYHPNIYYFGKFFLKVFSKLKILFYFRDELKIEKPCYYPTLINSYQAKIGISQLSNLKNNLNHRRSMVKICKKYISSKYATKKNFALLRYSFLVKSKKKFINKFSKFFDLDTWYDTVLHGRNKNFNKLYYKKGSCKNAEKICKHIVNFPTHLRIDNKNFETILIDNKKFIKNSILKNV